MSQYDDWVPGAAWCWTRWREQSAWQRRIAPGERSSPAKKAAHCGQSTASIRARSAFPRTTSWYRGGGGSGAPAAAAAATTTATAPVAVRGVAAARGTR